ncbi:hypothetical protein ANCCAN_24104 [Ancylostoma caninum]|uniref:Uncharacterized protein n=1 Tax=Ancylostoma caninum TaxID=29170 RepID=A0A368FEY6_ANCCA|nr:hypothetical protein ANCCAN_24104 [Ancylostoma caninum]
MALKQNLLTSSGHSSFIDKLSFAVMIPPREDEDLLNDAVSLRAKMLKFSEDLEAAIRRRKETDAECRRLAECSSIEIP